MALTLYTKGRKETETVGTTILSPFGASSWGDADDGSVQQRTIDLHVCSGSDIYFKVIDYTATLTATVSSTDKLGTLSAGQVATLTLARGEIVVVLSVSSSEVHARELIHAV